MKNICYLFGAGASCEILPLNFEIPERLRNLAEIIGNFLYQDEANIDKGRLELISDLNWLYQESKNHASVDTLAKKLYIKQDWKQLKVLRLTLSVYFICEQLGKTPDKRYDAFFASILDSSITSLPKNIKILTWNYDYQFELSLKSFGQIKSISEAKAYLGCTEKFKRYFIDGFKEFKLIKLNGDISLREESAGSSTFPFIDDYDLPLSKDSLRSIIQNWMIKRSSGEHFCSNISFAWENDASGFLNYVKETTKSCEILVVIGYSFPYFNRAVDREVINNMSTLKKVYIQTPDANDLAERFKSVDDREIEIIKRFDKHQFLIPNEM